jgi:hypothetical protein
MYARVCLRVCCANKGALGRASRKAASSAAAASGTDTKPCASHASGGAARCGRIAKTHKGVSTA